MNPEQPAPVFERTLTCHRCEVQWSIHAGLLCWYCGLDYRLPPDHEEPVPVAASSPAPWWRRGYIGAQLPCGRLR